MKLKNYKENKIFVTGISGSGKSIFAKEYSNTFNIEYFDFDANWKYDNSNSNEYEQIIKKYPTKFITDAIPYTCVNDKLKFLEYYDNYKNEIKIICLCCTNKDEFDNRIKYKFFNSVDQAYKEYFNFYFISLKKYYEKLNIEYYDTYSNEYISQIELYKRINWIVKYNLKEYLNIQEYDKYYQDIDCIDFVGYSKSYKTWENIKNLIEWKNKKVADLGCFHGYFSFKIAKEGADVTGFDINENVLKTTQYINEIENNIIKLKKWIGGDEIPSEYDIALCLNVIHHFSDIKKSLHNIKSKLVIFETNMDLIDVISEEFKILKKINSHRKDVNNNDRIILLCEKK